MLKVLVNSKKEKIGKPEICATIAEKTGIPLKSVWKMYDAYHESVMEAVSQNKAVAIKGFGTYSVSYYKEQFGHNPKTREEIILPERVMPKIRFGTSFRRMVTEGFSKLLRNTDAKPDNS